VVDSVVLPVEPFWWPGANVIGHPAASPRT
jgi:hypothetical protein